MPTVISRLKDGGLYLLGGWNENTDANSEVWFTQDLQDWSLLNAQAPWPPRHGSAWLVHQDRLYVIGGDLIDDVWSSADGVTWRQEQVAAPFGKRYTPVAVSTGEQIILYGGQHWEPYDWCWECMPVAPNDVWASQDGSSWTRLLDTAPWQGRALVHGGAYFQGRMYIVGGGLKISETVAEYSDIWSSSDGVEWHHEADELGFPPQTHFSITAAPDGCYVVGGSVGLQHNLSNDVFFAPDCVHFAELPGGSPMPVSHARSLAYFNGSIVVMAGFHPAGTVIWQYFPDTLPPN